MQFTLTMQWLTDHGIDYFEILEILDENNIDYYEDPDTQSLVFTATDANNDGIPDVLADIIFDPIVTNPSQGGAIGGDDNY